MADQCPDKKEIEQIFNRLRSITANKVCFDCNAKNPTWSSVTYGVFICIDCSAVHRSLGVHLTFVRSTQLDTNWTWLQLRQMQLGGNANASQFFRQHNCVSTDAQQKYNSRVASLYRDKLKHLAQQAMNVHGTKLHLDAAVEQSVPQLKEVDFFDKSHEEDGFNSNNIEAVEPLQSLKQTTTSSSTSLSQVGPSVDGVAAAPDRKPTIGVRKIQPKRSGLGGKKGGLGATKVKTNFADIEREANMNDQLREQAVADRKQNAVIKDEDEEKAVASMRLAYQDLSMQQTKEEQRIKAMDPKKAQQVERLGMGFANTRSAVSHSALSDMKTIEQENLDKGSSSAITSKSTFDRESDGFFDDFTFSSGNMYSSSSRPDRDGQSIMERSSTSSKSSGGWEIIEPETSSNNVRSMFNQDDKPKTKAPIRSTASEDAAQKKFGNVKSISSDQYFNEGASQYERNANLQRFQGSNSISSADYFGDGTSSTNRRNTGGYQGPQFQTPDLDDVKESVRQGVTKVAGKLSSLANGVMTSLQDKYGY